MDQGRSTQLSRYSCLAAMFALGLFSSGCSLADLKSPERMDKGLVIILPGMEGRSSWNYELARGLDGMRGPVLVMIGEAMRTRDGAKHHE